MNKKLVPASAVMPSIADNLQQKLDRHVSVKIECSAYDIPGVATKVEYSVYIAGTDPSHRHFESWPELLIHYRKLMKEGL